MASAHVIVVGGGVSGASAAYHLSRCGVDVTLIEAGSIGRGREERMGGTAVPAAARRAKMILTGFPDTAQGFIATHGEMGARLYVMLSLAGCELQKRLARGIDPTLLDERGAVALADASMAQGLEEELATYRALGFTHPARIGEQEVRRVFGDPCGFVSGVLFPHDAIIDSERYAQELLARSGAHVRENTRVARIEDLDEHAQVTLEDGTALQGDHVIVATNGIFMTERTRAMLRPCWSYLICVEDGGADTPCAFTWTHEFHDWARQGGVMRLSGEDRGGADEAPDPRSFEKLAAWGEARFPSMRGKPRTEHRAIYCETADELPLVGTLEGEERICYLTGCNAQGQATLSYAATLLPGILGYTGLSAEQEAFAHFLSPRRETLKKGFGKD